MTHVLEKPVQYLKGVGPMLAKKFARVSVDTVRDLLYYFPRAYDDRRDLPKIASLQNKLGEVVSTRGRLISITLIPTRSRVSMVRGQLIDDTSRLTVIWFNQEFLVKMLKKGMELFVRGKVELSGPRGTLQMTCQEYEVLKGGDSLSINRVVPLYPLTAGLYQKKVRSLTWIVVNDYLPALKDPFPGTFRTEQGLSELTTSLRELHFPQGRREWKLAHDRVVFDDFFYLQLRGAIQVHQRRHLLKSVSLTAEGDLTRQWRARLPYRLTKAQERVIAEIAGDMDRTIPMNRLLQGDVGCGKTEVALASMLIAVQSGSQAAFMAPTEILAEQHYKKLLPRLAELGVTVVCRTGSLKSKALAEVDDKIRSGEARVVIGTHALIQEKVVFRKLGLVIIDEQHRFGVQQRQTLVGKGHLVPHTLVMTATPIPRTLALTFYGELDKSIIDELPPGRIPIETRLIKERERQNMYDFAKAEIRNGSQIYVVYPLIEESEKVDLKAAVAGEQYLAKEIFPEYKVALVHGRMKPAEKEKVMNAFRTGDIKVLVATTVIEVGVDVPSASVMIIEHAERFGLAQLHQLRGRVGRGQNKAYCFLMANPRTEEGKKRLQAMVDTTDGFKLAEVDLQLRGPGEFYGTQQHGIPELALADLVKDEPILLKARIAAKEVVEKDTELLNADNYEIKRELLRRFPDMMQYKVLN
jgi:ATP-dependent DNA helicase RecG